MTMLKKLVTGLCLLITVNAISQNADFSGQWHLKNQESISGVLYENGASKKLQVGQTKEKIEVEKTTLGQDNADVVTRELYLFNGKAFETLTQSKRKKMISMKWDHAGKTITVTTSIRNASDSSKEDMKITDIWTLDKDGRLILIRKNENYLNGEVWESRSTYEKN